LSRVLVRSESFARERERERERSLSRGAAPSLKIAALL
jgi:hypothetical protein